MWGLTWAHAYLGLLIDTLNSPPNDDRKADTSLKVVGCNPFLCNVLPTCATTSLPRELSAAPALESLASAGHNWKLVDDGRRQENKHFGYLDLKVALGGDKSSGPLVFNFRTKFPDRPVAVCTVPCPWGRCPARQAVLEGNCRFTLDGQLADQGKGPSGGGNIDALESKDRCFIVASKVAAGAHTLQIDSTSPSGKLILVSHLIFY